MYTASTIQIGAALARAWDASFGCDYVNFEANLSSDTETCFLLLSTWNDVCLSRGFPLFDMAPVLDQATTEARKIESARLDHARGIIGPLPKCQAFRVAAATNGHILADPVVILNVCAYRAKKKVRRKNDVCQRLIDQPTCYDFTRFFELRADAICRAGRMSEFPSFESSLIYREQMVNLLSLASQRIAMEIFLMEDPLSEKVVAGALHICSNLGERLLYFQWYDPEYSNWDVGTRLFQWQGARCREKGVVILNLGRGTERWKFDRGGTSMEWYTVYWGLEPGQIMSQVSSIFDGRKAS